MDICGFVLLHCMFRMLRDQNLAPLNCGVSFETLIFLENSHFIEYKVFGMNSPQCIKNFAKHIQFWSKVG